jgi:hypothetical protein
MTTDLTELKEQLLRDYHADGMIETMLGFALLSGGLSLISRTVAVGGITPVLVILIARAWKHRITDPRLGYAEVHRTDRAARKRRALLVVVALAIVAGFSAVAFALRPDLAGTSDRVARFVFGGVVCAAVATAGLVQKLPHLCGVAAGLFVLIVIADHFRISAGYSLLVGGALLVVAGLVRLLLFVRANPRLRGGPPDAILR